MLDYTVKSKSQQAWKLVVKNGFLLLQIRQMKQKEAEQAEAFGHEWEDFLVFHFILTSTTVFCLFWYNKTQRVKEEQGVLLICSILQEVWEVEIASIFWKNV